MAALDRHLRRVLARLEAAVGSEQTAGPDPQPVSTEDAAEYDASAAVDELCLKLDLSPFERDILLMTVGVELDSRFHAACDAMGGPSFALALSALEHADWRALSPGSALRRWRLIELAPAFSTAHAVLRLDEAVLPYLLGDPLDDPRLESLRAGMSESLLTPSQDRLVENILAAWRPGSGLGPVLRLVTVETGAPTLEIARQVCEKTGFSGAIPISAAALPASSADLDLPMRLCERQARLDGKAVLLVGDADQNDAVVGRFMDRLEAPLIYATQSRNASASRPCSSFDIHKPTRTEQQALWSGALGGAVSAKMAWQFNLDASTITAIAAEATRAPETLNGGDVGAAAWAITRRRTRPKLDDLASRIATSANWDDLILPEMQTSTLKMVLAQASSRARVHDDWGFADKSDRGLGLTALFAGSSGTGKTTAAEVLAGTLNLDLYRVDLSAIVSKFIGETEKNLRQLFDTAEEGGVVLLFDEADALFGKRTEVRDSHDRNANIEVSYLLQRIEMFTGLAILTTNMRQSIDQAFLRRFRFIINFPFPDEAQRARIWRAAIPAAAEHGALNIAQLAKLALSGGQIRAVALNAAFLAAAENRPIQMSDLRLAAELEYGKHDKAPPAMDFSN